MYSGAPPRQDDSFYRFITNHGLEEHRIPLSKLSRLPGSNKVALAFDGIKILDIMTKAVRKENPMAVYTNCTPLNIYVNISYFCELATQTLSDYFDQNKVDYKPVFVFNGCGFVPTADIDPGAPPQPNHLSWFNASTEATSVLNVPQQVADQNAWRFVIESDVEGMIVRLFHQACPVTLRAPYLAWSQISAFLSPSNQYISEVYGSLELLAFPGVKRVITHIDEESMTFSCVSKAAVLYTLRKLYGEYTELDMSSFILFDCKNPMFYVKRLHCGFKDMCATKPHGSRSRADTFIHDVMYLPARRLLQRNLAALDAPVMTVEGGCSSLSKLYGQTKHSTVGMHFGRPLPQIMYYFLMAGPIMPELLASLGQNILNDNWPLIDTAHYRRVSESILPLRVQLNYQLFQYTCMPAQLIWLRQYVLFKKDAREDRRWSPIKDPPSIRLVNWRIDEEMLPDRPDKEVYFSDVIRFADYAENTTLMYHGVRATAAAVLIRAMDLLGYFTHETHQDEQSSACAFSLAVEKFDCPTLSEYGILVMELMRTRALTDDPMILTITEELPILPPGVRLAARLLSVIPLNVDSHWVGPFNPEIAAFGMISRMFSRTFRELTETIATLLFYNRSTSVPLSQFSEVLRLLPFALPTEFNAGFLVTYILLNPHCTVNNLKQVFPGLFALENDLVTLFTFWGMCYSALRVLDDPNLIPLPLPVFNEACRLVSRACQRLCPDTWEAVFRPLFDVYPEVYMSRGPAPNYIVSMSGRMGSGMHTHHHPVVNHVSIT